MGANSATKLIVSRDFNFGGNPVKAGTYSLYTIPSKTGFTVILGANADVWGTEVADKDKVVTQTVVKPTILAQPRERMIFTFSDTTDEGTNLDLEWEKVRVRVPIKVDTKAQVSASMEKALGDAWRPHLSAARYLLENGGDLDRALTYVEKSISIQPTLVEPVGEGADPEQEGEQGRRQGGRREGAGARRGRQGLRRVLQGRDRQGHRR